MGMGSVKEVEVTFSEVSGGGWLGAPKRSVQVGLYPPQLIHDGIDKSQFSQVL